MIPIMKGTDFLYSKYESTLNNINNSLLFSILCHSRLIARNMYINLL